MQLAMVPQSQGMAGFTNDGTGLLGTGLFSAGLDGPIDLSQWGAGEWIALGIGAFALYSMFSTSKQAYSGAKIHAKKAKRAVQQSSPWPWVAVGVGAIAVALVARNI